MSETTAVTVSVSDAEAREIVERAGGWQDARGRYNFGGGAAEHTGPFWELDEALTVALRSIAADAVLDT